MSADFIDISDKNAWDDSLLINSWDDAVAEYKRYHSIQKSGKKLEDVLTEEELEELREDHGHLMEEAETPISRATTNGDAEDQDADMELESSEEDHSASQVQAQQAPESAKPQPQQDQPPNIAAPMLQNEPLGASMPQALLGSVQDENLKNIMMSWYYAGYYTGLHVGRQQVSKNAAPNE
ncbi:hypothetical protein IAQ61_000086 [Plenodomus lingam]|uniref:Survival Motor Neuron Gemin2-binding domain-containing protein n=1 Tax=Leptosphaeria maculans (strain JN3 / isolate v23.1.3 / race Av1-4-5-6-7-8) TaxID=985895 RepID=E5R4A1_LEPMJ|nr:hypothetical protein LEMA_P045750.1 [Plenodomus lingam JN3]KAH9881362.1 hypothetical protein IAQ61_000086 [Plenodomus lingam]CBX91869.1 hypothetical protein LEMA_P045750.1 [Plenodomus lingam JN3]